MPLRVREEIQAVLRQTQPALMRIAIPFDLHRQTGIETLASEHQSRMPKAARQERSMQRFSEQPSAHILQRQGQMVARHRDLRSAPWWNALLCRSCECVVWIPLTGDTSDHEQWQAPPFTAESHYGPLSVQVTRATGYADACWSSDRRVRPSAMAWAISR